MKDLNVERLVLRLAQQFPGDVGLFCPFLLNAFKIKSGQAIYLSANVPHAYISGDVIECMACSDNVVRAGLTPKLRDTQVLCSMVDCTPGKPLLVRKTKVDAFTNSYAPPVREFQLSITTLPPCAYEEAPPKYALPAVPSSAIVLVYQGKGTISGFEVQRGTVLCVDKGQSVECVAAGPEPLIFYRCFTPGQDHAEAKQ